MATRAATAEQPVTGRAAGGRAPFGERAAAVVAALARPWVAFAAALAVYLLRAAWGTGLARSADPYFNYLADAFLQSQAQAKVPH